MEDQDTEKRVDVVLAEATALDPSKHYLILIDRMSITREEAVYVQERLREWGVKHIICIMTDGDPATAVQVVET